MEINTLKMRNDPTSSCVIPIIHSSRTSQMKNNIQNNTGRINKNNTQVTGMNFQSQNTTRQLRSPQPQATNSLEVKILSPKTYDKGFFSYTNDKKKEAMNFLNPKINTIELIPDDTVKRNTASSNYFYSPLPAKKLNDYSEDGGIVRLDKSNNSLGMRKSMTIKCVNPNSSKNNTSITNDSYTILKNVVLIQKTWKGYLLRRKIRHFGFLYYHTLTKFLGLEKLMKMKYLSIFFENLTHFNLLCESRDFLKKASTSGKVKMKTLDNHDRDNKALKSKRRNGENLEKDSEEFITTVELTNSIQILGQEKEKGKTNEESITTKDREMLEEYKKQAEEIKIEIKNYNNNLENILSNKKNSSSIELFSDNKFEIISNKEGISNKDREMLEKYKKQAEEIKEEMKIYNENLENLMLHKKVDVDLVYENTQTFSLEKVKKIILPIEPILKFDNNDEFEIISPPVERIYSNEINEKDREKLEEYKQQAEQIKEEMMKYNQNLENLLKIPKIATASSPFVEEHTQDFSYNYKNSDKNKIPIELVNNNDFFQIISPKTEKIEIVNTNIDNHPNHLNHEEQQKLEEYKNHAKKIEEELLLYNEKLQNIMEKQKQALEKDSSYRFNILIFDHNKNLEIISESYQKSSKSILSIIQNECVSIKEDERKKKKEKSHVQFKNDIIDEEVNTSLVLLNKEVCFNCRCQNPECLCQCHHAKENVEDKVNQSVSVSEPKILLTESDIVEPLSERVLTHESFEPSIIEDPKSEEERRRQLNLRVTLKRIGEDYEEEDNDILKSIKVKSGNKSKHHRIMKNIKDDEENEKKKKEEEVSKHQDEENIEKDSQDYLKDLREQEEKERLRRLNDKKSPTFKDMKLKGAQNLLRKSVIKNVNEQIHLRNLSEEDPYKIPSSQESPTHNRNNY